MAKKKKQPTSAPDWLYPLMGLPPEEPPGPPTPRMPLWAPLSAAPPGEYYAEPQRIGGPNPWPTMHDPQQTPPAPGSFWDRFWKSSDSPMLPEADAWLQGLIKERGPLGAANEVVTRVLSGPGHWGSEAPAPTPQVGWPTDEQFAKATAPNMAAIAAAAPQRIGQRTVGGGGAAPGPSGVDTAYQDQMQTFDRALKDMLAQKATMQLEAQKAWQQYQEMSQQKVPQPGLGDVMRQGFANVGGAMAEQPDYGRQAAIRTERSIEQQLEVQRQNAQNILEKYNQMFQAAIKAGDMAGALEIQQKSAEAAQKRWMQEQALKKQELASEGAVRAAQIASLKDNMSSGEASFKKWEMTRRGRTRREQLDEIRGLMLKKDIDEKTVKGYARTLYRTPSEVYDPQTNTGRLETPDEYMEFLLYDAVNPYTGKPLFSETEAMQMRDAYQARLDKRKK